MTIPAQADRDHEHLCACVGFAPGGRSRSTTACKSYAYNNYSGTARLLHMGMVDIHLSRELLLHVDCMSGTSSFGSLNRH